MNKEEIKILNVLAKNTKLDEIIEKLTIEKLQEILRKHSLWLEGKEGGKRAVMRHVDLSDLNLSGLDLRKIDFTGTHFNGSNLSNADLRDSNLDLTTFWWANLEGANLLNTSRNDISFRWAENIPPRELRYPAGR